MIELNLKSPSDYEQFHARRLAEDAVASERDFEQAVKQLPVMRKAKKKGSKK
jgi:hypothetical protein